MGRLTCGNEKCRMVFERTLTKCVNVVVCPNCGQKVEIHLMNTTVPEQMALFTRILKEGKKK